MESPEKKISSKEFGRDGENLAENQPVLDTLILNSEIIEAREARDELNRMFDTVKNDPLVAHYFRKQDERPNIEEQVAYLEEGVKNAIDNADSKISKETLEKMLTQLRGYEFALKNLNQELSSSFNEDINIQMAVKKLNLIEEEMKNVDNKLERSVEMYEKNQERDLSSDVSPGLN